MKKFLITVAVFTAFCLSMAGNPASSVQEKPAMQEMHTTIIILLPNGTVIILKT